MTDDLERECEAPPDADRIAAIRMDYLAERGRISSLTVYELTVEVWPDGAWPDLFRRRWRPFAPALGFALADLERG